MIWILAAFVIGGIAGGLGLFALGAALEANARESLKRDEFGGLIRRGDEEKCHRMMEQVARGGWR